MSTPIKLSKNEEVILHELRVSSTCTAYYLARCTGLAEASVRRSIQQLRAKGYYISLGPYYMNFGRRTNE